MKLMKKYIKKISVVCIMAFAISMVISSLAFAAQQRQDPENTDIKTAAQNKAKSQIVSLLTEGFSPYYDILDIKTEITEVDDTAVSLHVYVKTTMNSVLKAKSVAELPHVQGMLKAVKLNDLKKDSVENTVKAIKLNKDLLMNDSQIRRAAKLLQDKITDIEPYIGKPDESDFMFKFNIPKTNAGIASGSGELLLEDFDKYVPAKHIIPKSSQEMVNDGIEEIMAGINDSKLDKNVALLYPGYDRLDARDYAIANTSWATTYCPHYPTHECQQDITFWNTGHYPAYLDVFCHNDCADFVSQALHYGGIPEDSTWYRVENQRSWSDAWIKVLNLKTYMTGKGYWSASNYTNAAAGGVRVWPGNSHIGMIIKNDTVTREFAAHTYDRTHYQYSDEPGMYYYILW